MPTSRSESACSAPALTQGPMPREARISDAQAYRPLHGNIATRWATLGKRSVVSWIDDGASSMGAALAFYSLLSMAPLLLMVITIAGFFFGEEAARGALIEELSGLFGESGGKAIEATLAATRNHDEGLISLWVSIVMILVGATTVFAELQGDLDRIWRVSGLNKPPIGTFLRARMVSFGAIVGVGFLLAVSLVLSAGVSAVGSAWNQWFEGADFLLQTLNTMVSFGVITLLFAMIFKLLPSVRIAWREVWVGAAFTSLLFSIGKYLIGLYIGTAAISSSFGAAGALVVIVVWVYYSSQIFLLGAELTHEYALSRVGVSLPKSDDPPPSDDRVLAIHPEEALKTVRSP